MASEGAEQPPAAVQTLATAAPPGSVDTVRLEPREGGGGGRWSFRYLAAQKEPRERKRCASFEATAVVRERGGGGGHDSDTRIQK